MAMNYNRFNELAKLVLSSPQGLFAVVVAITSTIALIYLFLTKSTQSATNRSSSKSKSNATKSSPTKQQSPVKKSSLKKKEATPKKESPSKTTSAPNKVSGSKSSSDKKVASSAEKKAGLAAQPTSKPKQANGSSKPNQNKDDGEWITVSSKKKTLRAKKTVEAPSAPQTRMSTRRSTQNSQTPKRV